MQRLLTVLRRHARRKGVRDGSHTWLSIWIVIAAAQLVRRFIAAKPDVERIELRPGETIMITDLGRLDQLEL